MNLMDDIRRKLTLIDKQLKPGNLHRQIISTSPLLLPAVGLMTGIVIQDAISGPDRTNSNDFITWVLLAVPAISAVVALWVLASHKYKLQPHTAAYIAFVCFACLGAVRLLSFGRGGPTDIRNFVGKEPKLATIRGLVISEPYRERKQWYFAHLTYSDPSSSFYMKLLDVKTGSGWTKVAGKIRVQVDEPVLDIRAGDYIQAYCWLNRFEPPSNPGEFDIQKYLARKNIFVAASIRSRDAIEPPQPHPGGTFVKFKRHLQEIASRALLGEMDVENENYALLQALTLGYRTQIDSRTYRAFQETGLLHFISLSGMNFMIVIGVVWWLCKIAGLMKPARALVCLFAAVMFLLVVPPQPPATRAAIMSSVFCASFFFRRKSSPYNSLALAAIILLLIRPTSLFEADWQLSFAAVLGILLFTPPILNWIFEKTIDRLREEKQRHLFLRIVSKATAAVITTFVVSLAAWLATAGILLYHFYTLNYLTSIWTVLVSPLIAIVSIAGYLKIFLSLVLPHTAGLLYVIIKPSAEALIGIVKTIASWNISHISIGLVSPAIVIGYHALLLLALAPMRWLLVKRLICVTTAVVIIISLGAVKWNRTHRDALSLTCLDVGHGQAILARLPGKANILFDAGSLSRKDIGTRIVTPFLSYCGINQLDAIVISHNDIDHINGIPEIIESCKVKNICANDVFFTEADGNSPAGLLNQYVKKKGLAVKPLKELPEFASEARITTLWPEGKLPSDIQFSENDQSLVCSIDFAGVKVLLCSDIEQLAQKELLRKYPGLQANIVIAPHHGSARTLDVGFLDSLSPDIVVSSCSKTQYESQQVLTRSPAGKLLSTAEYGAITVRIDKDGSVETSGFARRE